MQLLEARRIRNRYNEIISEATQDAEEGLSGEGRTKRQKWSIVHGYCGVMGGFALSTAIKREEKGAILGKTLTPRGIIWMAEKNLLPEIDPQKVKSKSKADQLAKAIVCLQAGCMVVQAIARAAEGLPITLLELNTMAHVGCAFLMYGIWWKKPQGVVEPIEITLDTATTTVLNRRWFFRDFEHESYWQKANMDDGTSTEQQSPPLTSSQDDVTIAGIIQDDDIKVGQVVHVNPSPGPTNVRVISRPPGNSLDTVLDLDLGSKLEGSPFIARDKVCLRARDIEDLDKAASIKPSRYDSLIDFIPFNGFTEDVSHLRIIGNLRDESDLGTLLLFALLGLAYGGIHACSWQNHFPTSVEHTVWRIAVCVVAGGGFPIAGVWALTKNEQDEFRSDWPNTMPLNIRPFCDKIINWYFVLLVAPMLVILVPAFFTARIYLVVEAFVSIRSLPIGAYKTASWMNLLPHVG